MGTPSKTGSASAPSKSRREFLRTSGGAASAAVASTMVARAAYAGENNTIKIALVGCGGRGTGAASQALSTSGPTKLWAMADVFPQRLKGSLNTLSRKHAKQIDAPTERQFIGLDAYKQAIDSLGPGDVVLLTTPPAFRPIHLEYAVEKGVNVFMEKSFAVDAPGVRRVMKAVEVAKKKNLKVAGGLMWRHDSARQAVIDRIHDGAIGDIHTMRTYRMHGPVGLAPKMPGMSELAHQIRNYSCFTWVNASFFVDWLIHNIDVCCWAKNAWPVAAQGSGGRQARKKADQMWDHYDVEYIFADGARLFAKGRHMAKCWSTFGDYAHGSKGSALIMESLGKPNPRLYKNQNQTKENETWRYEGPQPNPYQVEHNRLFDAIRRDATYNEGNRCARAVMTAIMGRMAAHSGQLVTFDQALNSKLQLAPELEKLAWDGPAPVMPNERGQYPVAVPGVSKVL